MNPRGIRRRARVFIWLLLCLLFGFLTDARTIPTRPQTSYNVSSDGSTVLGNLIEEQQREAWLSHAKETFIYDVRGNLRSDGCWDYTWDGANRLRFIETSATAVTAGVAREKFGYRYDYQGRRVAKDVYAWTGSAYESDPSETTLYYYDGWNLVYEATYTGVTFNSGVPTAATFESEIAYHWGLDWSASLQGAGGVGGLVAITFRDAGGSAETRFPGFDGNGNLVLLADESGTVTAAYEYGPYGELWRTSGPDASKNPFRFSTKYRDAETALYYYGHRYYSPDYGRFISQDPIRESGGLNLYAFVNNNPTNYYDYLGMFFDVGGAFDSASNFVGGVSNNFFQFDTGSNFESDLGSGWSLTVPTFDFGLAYYDLGLESRFSARTTSSSGDNWSFDFSFYDTTTSFADTSWHTVGGSAETASQFDQRVFSMLGGSSGGNVSDYFSRQLQSVAQNPFTVAGMQMLGGFVPGIGEGMDAYDLAYSDSGFSRGVAGFSLAANAWNFGAAPNLSGIRRGVSGGLDAIRSFTRSPNVSPSGLYDFVSDANSGLLRSSDNLMGVERASDDLMSAIGSRRDLRTGDDIVRLLDSQGAEAAMFDGTNLILHRPDPSKAAMLEEFLHGTQSRLGLTTRSGFNAESHVKDFMIRHHNLLGLSPEDVSRLQQLKDAGL